MSTILKVDNLHKAYDRVPIIKGVSFDVNEGETFAIIGPNGAGKTTLFKLLTGEIFAERGTVHYRGENISDLPGFKRVHLGIARTFQVARVFPDCSAVENVVVAVEARCRIASDGVGPWYARRPPAEVTDEAVLWLTRVGLENERDVEARYLSHGNKKRLELAIAIAIRPRVLMMDEPTAGMSPSERDATVDLVRRIRVEHDITILVTEHDMDVVFSLASRIMVMNYGEIIAMGAPTKIRGNPLVREVYLGKEMQDA